MKDFPGLAVVLQLYKYHLIMVTAVAGNVDGKSLERAMKKVHEAENVTEAHMIADMLERGGIPAQVKGEHDPLMPASVWILDGNKYQEARDMIASIPPDTGREDEKQVRYEASRSGFWGGLGVGIGVAVLAWLGLLITTDIIKDRDMRDTNGDGKMDSWTESLKGGRTVEKDDTNYDGRPDAWSYYSGSQLERSQLDTNFDGKPDVWHAYEGGGKETIMFDDDFDGRVDEWNYYTNGIITDFAIDNDRDGKEDEWGHYENGRVAEAKWSFMNDRIIDKAATYSKGRKTSEQYDRDRDGTFDETIHYDEFERVLKVER